MNSPRPFVAEEGNRESSQYTNKSHLNSIKCRSIAAEIPFLYTGSGHQSLLMSRVPTPPKQPPSAQSAVAKQHISYMPLLVDPETMPGYAILDNERLLACTNIAEASMYQNLYHAFHEGNLQPALDEYLCKLQESFSISKSTAEEQLKRLLDEGFSDLILDLIALKNIQGILTFLQRKMRSDHTNRSISIYTSRRTILSD